MFSAANFTPKTYETSVPNTSGNLALLMKALQATGGDIQSLSQNAGETVAQGKLDAMSPTDRAGTNVMDKLQGLSLTDKFRERLLQGEKDAVARNVAEQKNTYDIERDKTKHGYDLERDKANAGYALQRTNAAVKAAGGAGTQGIVTTPEDNLAMQQIDATLMDYLTAMAASDTQSGISLENRAASINELRKAKYELLRKQGYPEVTARNAAYTDEKSIEEMLKQIRENNKGNLSKK